MGSSVMPFVYADADPSSEVTILESILVTAIVTWLAWRKLWKGLSRLYM
jgi:hypothetical protein